MQTSNALDLLAKCLATSIRQHGDTVSVPFAVAHDHVSVIETHVLHSQPPSDGCDGAASPRCADRSTACLRGTRIASPIRIAHTARTDSVFLNAQGQPITRFGIRYIVRRYAAKAAEACPSLKSKKISPHSIRHTTAMHLLQSGNDLSVIKDWMGHADVNTTHGYVKIDMKMKRKALETRPPPEVETPKKKRAKWQQPGILKWLDDLSKSVEIMRSPSPASVAATG